MELRQLIYLKAIIEHGSISAAARYLHLSQPPLTYAMEQLEQEVGVKLFLRSAKGIEPTEAGRILYARANDILNRSASALREVSTIAEKKTCRIGVTPTVVPVIAPVLARFVKENRNVQLELQEGNTYYLKELLDDGSIDAAVIRTPVNLQGCRFLQIMEEPMAAVGRTNHRRNLSLKELSKEPLILYRRYESLLQDTFRKYSLEMNLICECDDARTALRLAEEGMGTAVVPMASAKMQKELSPARIQTEELTTSILLAWHTSNPLINALTALLQK